MKSEPDGAENTQNELWILVVPENKCSKTNKNHVYNGMPKGQRGRLPVLTVNKTEQQNSVGL